MLIIVITIYSLLVPKVGSPVRYDVLNLELYFSLVYYVGLGDLMKIVATSQILPMKEVFNIKKNVHTPPNHRVMGNSYDHEGGEVKERRKHGWYFVLCRGGKRCWGV